MSGDDRDHRGYGVPAAPSGGRPEGADRSEHTATGGPSTGGDAAYDSVLSRSDGTGARSPRRRTWLIAAAGVLIALVAIVVVVALRSPVGVVARAVAATLATGSARTEVAATVEGIPALGEVQLAVAEGAVDFSSGHAQLTRELVGGVSTEVRYVDEGVYVGVPFADDRFVRLSESDARGTDDVTAVAPGLGNPVALIGLLRTLEDEPRELGGATVDGVAVRVYEVIVDLDTAAALADEEIGRVIGRLRAVAGGSRLPVRLGIDEERRIRSIEYQGTIELAGILSPGLTTRVELSEFGTPVDVATPPPDRVVDLDPSQLIRPDWRAILRGLVPRLF